MSGGEAGPPLRRNFNAFRTPFSLVLRKVLWTYLSGSRRRADRPIIFMASLTWRWSETDVSMRRLRAGAAIAMISGGSSDVVIFGVLKTKSALLDVRRGDVEGGAAAD